MTAPISKRILILDDDEMRNMLQLLLTAEGHSVTTVTGGSEAVSLHQKNPFDLAIIELFMTGCNGFEVFAKLRHGASPPKFIVTAKSVRIPSEDYLKVAKRLGAHETLAKPFIAEQLLAAVRSVFNIKA